MAREKWGSKLGVVLAVAGSAVGLGNFLRFPGKAALYGGGAFLIPYFIALLLIGLPLMWVEWTIGRFGGGFGHSTAPGMFHNMWKKNRFIKYFGVIGIFGPVLIYMYYVYIESWLLGYSFFAVTGKYGACATKDTMAAFLNGYRGIVSNEYFDGIGPAYLFFLITFAVNMTVVYFGIRKGIQKVCEIAMPVLFCFAVVLAIRVFTLGAPDPQQPENNVVNGLGYLWNPDWSRLLDPRVWLEAAGQICFTLSVGIGVILTYSSYLSKDDDVALSGLTAASANEFAEVVLGGSIIIPAAFAFFGATGTTEFAEKGIFDLGFVTMPLILEKLAFGNILGFMWFGLLFIAGVTSSISLAQPAIAFLEDEFNLNRKEATLTFGLVSFVLCHIAIFGLGTGAVDELDFWGGTFCLVLFGAIETIMFAWVFGIDRAWSELHAGSDITIPRFYRFIIRYVTPLLLLVILGAYIVLNGIPQMTLKGMDKSCVPTVMLTRIVVALLFILLCLMVWLAWRKRSAEERSPEA